MSSNSRIRRLVLCVCVCLDRNLVRTCRLENRRIMMRHWSREFHAAINVIEDSRLPLPARFNRTVGYVRCRVRRLETIDQIPRSSMQETRQACRRGNAGEIHQIRTDIRQGMITILTKRERETKKKLVCECRTLKFDKTCTSFERKTRLEWERSRSVCREGRHYVLITHTK